MPAFVRERAIWGFFVLTVFVTGGYVMRKLHTQRAEPDFWPGEMPVLAVKNL